MRSERTFAVFPDPSTEMIGKLERLLKKHTDNSSTRRDTLHSGSLKLKVKEVGGNYFFIFYGKDQGRLGLNGHIISIWKEAVDNPVSCVFEVIKNEDREQAKEFLKEHL